MTVPDAYSRDGEPLRASKIDSASWVAMKAVSQADPGAFVMACCKSRAVLKTSVNGLQFFAHHDAECATAPETRWHVEGKDACVGTLRALGITARTEVDGAEIGAGQWRADVFFEIGERRVALELQRSYQHFNDFRRRQDSYTADQVECFWLTRLEVARPLMKAIGRHRIRHEFGGVVPGAFFPAIRELPWVIFSPEEGGVVSGPALRLSLREWLSMVLAGEYVFDGEKWGRLDAGMAR